MIKSVLLPGLLAAGMVFSVWAQSDAEYQGWMKDAQGTSGKIRKGVQAKTMDSVAADATHMAEIYANLVKFWEAKKVDDAVTISKNGEAAAKAIAEAAKANDEAKVQSSAQALNGTCQGCHMAHRGGTPPNFTIK